MPPRRSSRRKRGLSPESSDVIVSNKKPKPSLQSDEKTEEDQDTAQETTPVVVPEAVENDVSAKVPEPDYQGTFDIFAAGYDKAALYDIWSPFKTKGWDAPHEPDSLYEEIKRRQALGECTARIELRTGGMYRGRAINQEAEEEGCPGDFIVGARRSIERWEMTLARDDTDMYICGDLFDLLDEGDTRPGPAVEVSLRVAQRGCGIENASGMLKMRRMWAQNKDGVLEEVFEGYLKVGVDFNVLLKHRFYAGERKRHNGADKDYTYPFWAIRARKLADGTVVGVNELKVRDGDESE